VIPLTIRHVYDFGGDRGLVGDDLVRPEDWDALRVQTDGPFALPATREAWERSALERLELVARAAAVSAWADGTGAQRIASYGVGGATLEYLLWRERPQRGLILSDYAPAAVQRLAGLFPEAEVRRFDLLADPPLDADVHLFHRVDTELTNDQWRTVLGGRFAGVRVLLVATEVASLRRMSWEVRSRLSRRPTTRAGWLRNRAAFERLWRDSHVAEPVRMHDLDAWDLRPRAAA
jgi:hypothetical protein